MIIVYFLHFLYLITVPVVTVISYGQYGDNWFRAEVHNGRWNSLCSDSTGQNLAAVQMYGNIFTSSSGYYTILIILLLLKILYI